MPHDAVIVGQEIVPAQNTGDHDTILVSRYIAPADGDGGIAFDPYQAADAEAARKARDFIVSRFPIQYPWCVESDIHQGILKISIPILMGICNWYVINLRTAPDIGEAILKGVGEVLERYLLPRDKFHLGKFLEARALHSALVMQNKRVPN